MNSHLIFGSGLSAYKDLSGLSQVCHVALQCGITTFDTAPSYHTEALIAQAVQKGAEALGMNRSDYAIQTKIDPIQMYDGDVVTYFQGKLQEMHLDYVDSLLIHWPVEKYLPATWDALLRMKEMGLTRHIGICNLRVRHLRRYEALGIIPEILQIERHPLNTFQEEVDWCHAHHVQLQDYSPLCKMHPRIKENEELNAIADRHGRDLGQIILRWHIDTGATPVFTSKNVDRIRQYANISDFALSQDEIDIVSKLNCNHKLYLESLVCPGF